MYETPRFSKISTPPLAKYPALPEAKSVGISTTRFTPFLTAISARVHLSRMAKLPRWVKLPLMTATLTSAPVSSRDCLR